MGFRLSGWDDTIVALATPPGVSALAIIRLTGKNSIDIADQLLGDKNLHDQASHTLHYGFLKNGDDIIDEVIVSLFKTPRSYTGEDVVEISCHGSPFIQQKIIEACVHHGARLAKPGEFTQRAFLAGKLDLAQAEAVADLIASNTEASHKTAVNNIRGGFSNALKNMREQLIKFSALIELELDFSQEDVEFADRKQLNDLIENAIKQTAQLLQSFQLGNVIKNGVSVAIIGKPNAGKSTLLNALLNEDRAIVSDIPGTTRDTIEEIINIDGILFRLIDTAGIRSHSADVIESAGIEKSMQKMQQANVVLYLFDVNDEHVDSLQFTVQELKRKTEKFLLVGNKVDLVNEQDVRDTFSSFENMIFISARNALHLDDLNERMLDAVLEGNLQAENTIVTNARHYHALQKVNDALHDVSQGLQNKISSDLLSLDIRRCLQYLGEITGEVTNEDLLDYIFSKFCIGK